MDEIEDESTDNDLSYERAVIRRSTAAIIQNIGFSHAHNSSINVLADLMENWLTTLSQLTMRYTTSAGHTICSIADVSQGLSDMNFNLVELNDYISSVASFELPIQVPSFPVNEPRAREPSSPTDVTDEITIRQLRADRHERIMSRFPNYTLILAASAADEVEANQDNSFDSLASGVMALYDPASLRAKSKKIKKKRSKAIKETNNEDQEGVDDFAEPSSSLWLNKKRLNESSISTMVESPRDEFGATMNEESIIQKSEVTDEYIHEPEEDTDGNYYTEEQEEVSDDALPLEEEKYEAMSSSGLRLRLRRCPANSVEDEASTEEVSVEEEDEASSIENTQREEEEKSSNEDAQYVVVSLEGVRLRLRRC